jgi:hypothetical protein
MEMQASAIEILASVPGKSYPIYLTSFRKRADKTGIEILLNLSLSQQQDIGFQQRAVYSSFGMSVDGMQTECDTYSRSEV